MEDRSDPNARLHQVRSHKRGEACVYSPASNDGKCLICKEEHFDCNFIAEPRCSTCYKSAEECPAYASKASYVIGKLLQLRKNDRDGKSNVSPLAARVYASAGNHRPLKVIVFSEFRDIYVSPWDVYGSAYSLSSLTLCNCQLCFSGILWQSTCQEIRSKFLNHAITACIPLWASQVSLHQAFLDTSSRPGHMCCRFLIWRYAITGTTQVHSFTRLLCDATLKTRKCWSWLVICYAHIFPRYVYLCSSIYIFVSSSCWFG